MNENTNSNTSIVLPPHSDIYHNSASDVSTGTNDVSSSGVDKNTNHHCITDSKNNYDSHSYDTTQLKKLSHSFGDTISTTTTTRLPTLPPTGK